MSGRLQSIDVLRGLAVLAVLAIHCPHDAPGGYRENIWFLPSLLSEYGYLGVHLFVLLSGFCIHRRAAIEKKKTGHWKLNWLEFWKRRFWRLYPPYLAAIVVSLVAATFLHDRFVIQADQIGWDLALHAVMLHNLTADFGTSLGNGAFWSLGMEEQLYAGYFLLLLMVRHKSVALALGVTGIITLLWRLVTANLGWVDVGPFEIGKWYLWPMMFWLHWTLGAVSVDASQGNIKLPTWTNSIVVAFVAFLPAMIVNEKFAELLTAAGKGGVLDSLLPDAYRKPAYRAGELFAALGFFCLMNWILDKEQTWIVKNQLSRFIAWLGRISYSIYLVHIPVVYWLWPYDPFVGTGIQWPLRALMFGGVSILAGWGFFHAVEKWFLKGRMPQFRRTGVPSESGPSAS